MGLEQAIFQDEVVDIPWVEAQARGIFDQGEVMARAFPNAHIECDFGQDQSWVLDVERSCPASLYSFGAGAKAIAAQGKEAGAS